MNESFSPTSPELQQSVLDATALRALFTDLKSCAEVLAVIPKVGSGAVKLTEISLSDAYHCLMNRSIRGLQIRYLYQEEEWWDTLIPHKQGFRIVRIKQEFP